MVRVELDPQVKSGDFERLKTWDGKQSARSESTGGKPIELKDGITGQAIRVARLLGADPFVGSPWEGRDDEFVELTGCRRVYFDLDAFNGKPRFRMVYRLFPDEDAPDLVWVIAVGERANMAVYTAAVTRLPIRRPGP